MDSLSFKRIRRALFLSLFLHIAITVWIAFGPGNFLSQPKETLTIELVSAEPEPKPTPRPLKELVEERKQVVDQDEKPVNDELDEKTKFLSANNQKVQKQTIAKVHGDFKNKASKSNRKGEKGQFQPLKVDDLLPKMDYSKTYRDMLEMEKTKEKSMEVAASTPKPAPKPVNQKQSGEDVSQTIDYIKDLDPGLETMLSTREFVYYTYYARIRRQLNVHWTPKVKEKIQKIYREGRYIASSDDRVTRCLVTLDKKGNLEKVQIIGNSGIRELDEAAVEAFRAAAPFPNPPNGIVDDDGTIKIRWDFILEA